MKHKLLWLSAILICCSCSDKSDKKGVADADTRHSVYVATVGGADSDGARTLTGVVEENDNISLGFKTAGQIKRIYVKEGDRIRKGQLLAELDASDYQLGVEALQIQYDQLKEEVARARRLYEKNSMTANDFEKAVAGLRQLGVQLQVNKNKLAYTRLYAPAAGTVESVNFAPAEMVDAGTAVFTLLDMGRMEVVCDIPANLYMDRGLFTRFSCRSAHIPGREIPLQLISIVPKADGNQLYRMHFALGSDAGSRITPGMNVEVSIGMAGDGKGGVGLPSSALFRKGCATYVWVVKSDSTVVKREVGVKGNLDGAEVIVESGLAPGDRVVRAGVSALHEGEKVKVIEAPSETNVGGLL